MRSFLEYEWPGNVRELENIIELMVNTESIPDGFMKTYDNGTGTAEGYAIRSDQAVSSGLLTDECLELEFMEKNHILKVLDLYGGNISLCAKTPWDRKKYTLQKNRELWNKMFRNGTAFRYVTRHTPHFAGFFAGMNIAL